MIKNQLKLLWTRTTNKFVKIFEDLKNLWQINWTQLDGFLETIKSLETCNQFLRKWLKVSTDFQELRSFSKLLQKWCSELKISETNFFLAWSRVFWEHDVFCELSKHNHLVETISETKIKLKSWWKFILFSRPSIFTLLKMNGFLNKTKCQTLQQFFITKYQFNLKKSKLFNLS